MEESRTALQPDRPSNVFNGNLMFAHLGSNHAEKIECVGMIRLDLKNLPVDLFGGLQPTTLMVLYCNCKCFGNCCHSVNYDNTTCQPQCASRERATWFQQAEDLWAWMVISNS